MEYKPSGPRTPNIRLRLKYFLCLPFAVLLLFCLSLLFTACDETFEPIGGSETSAFSMYGYLDASADTQWVRVAPLRNQVDPPDQIPEMRVTLKHLESGEEVVMKDSLFALDESVPGTNVYTSELDIQPEQKYQLKAERPDGVSSHVTVTIPPDFPTPFLITGGFDERYGNVFLRGIDRVADVQTLWRLDGKNYRIPYRVRVRDYSPPGYDYKIDLHGDYAVSFIFDEAPPPYSSDILEGGNVQRQVFVVSGGPEWMEGIVNLEDQIYALPQVVSNVENGVGYVIGTVSKTIPFKTCYNEDGDATACPPEKPMF